MNKYAIAIIAMCFVGVAEAISAETLAKDIPSYDLDSPCLARPESPIGAPLLPYAAIGFDVPSDVTVGEIAVFGEWVVIDGELEAIQEAQPINEEPLPYVKDASLFAEDWPKAEVENLGYTVCAGEEKLQIKVTPFRYNNGVLEALRNGRIVLTVEGLAPRGRMMLAGAGESVRPRYVLISPHEYVGDWNGYLNMRAGQRTDVEFVLKDAAEIYEAYPFDKDNTDGAPRNPAESIHQFIREDFAANATRYYVLGGSYVDAKSITSVDDTRLMTKMPGITCQPYNGPNDANPVYDKCPVSDMFYACLDLKDGQKYPWDANENGRYLDSSELGDNVNDFIADVVVSRIPLKSSLLNERAVIAAFSNKVERIEGPEATFRGQYRMASAGGQVEREYTPSSQLFFRDEREFYDGGLNMFDPRHAGRCFDAEILPRNTLKNIVSKRRPVLEGNPLFQYSWGAEYPNYASAVDAYFTKDHDYSEYRDHGSATYLYGHFITRERYLAATGLTRIIMSGFSCTTACIDGDVTLGEAEIVSGHGGAMANVHNSRTGLGYKGMAHVDNDGLSSSLQWRMKVELFDNDCDIGTAWLRARQWYAPGRSGSHGRKVMIEQLLMGDPLARLSPPVLEKTLEDTNIAVTEDMGYTTLNLSGVNPVITGDKVFKVMQGLNVKSGHALTFAADGGVGGEGIDFKNGEGTLTIATPKKSYFVQPTGAKEVVLAGNGTTLDFEQATPKFKTLTLKGEGEKRSGNILRGRVPGQLKGFVPIAVENTEVALGTVDALKVGEGNKLATVTNGGLGITFNPNYGLENSWEYFTGSIELSDGSLFVDATETAGFGRPDQSGLVVAVKGETSVETRNGGKATVFGTTTFNLEDDATLKFGAAILRDEKTDGKIVINGGTTVVESVTGIGGEITINEGVLELKELPLKNVTKLTLLGASKLVIPTNDEGYYQVLSGKGVSLSISDESRVFSLEDETTPIVGRSTSTGAIFDVSKFTVWNQVAGDWNDTQSGRTKIYFPDIEDADEVVVNLPAAITCSFAAFGNTSSTYRFTGAPLTIGNAVLSERIVFENEVSAPNGVVVSSGTIGFATLRTPQLTIEEGATVSAINIVSQIETIKGIRFYPIKTTSGGANASILELRFNTATGILPLAKGTLSYDSSLATISGANILCDNNASGFGGSIMNSETCCELVEIEKDAWSNEKFFLQYMFDEAQPMVTSYSLAASAVTSKNSSQSLTDFRVDVSSDGINWSTVSKVKGTSIPTPGFGDMWYSVSSRAFGINNPTAKVFVDKGATLLLKGEATGEIHFAEGAKLKVALGEKMMLGVGSMIELPKEGYAIVDVSNLELDDIGDGLTILYGVSFTEEQFKHLTTRGKPWMTLCVENGNLVIKVDKKPPRVLFK